MKNDAEDMCKKGFLSTCTLMGHPGRDNQGDVGLSDDTN